MNFEDVVTKWMPHRLCGVFGMFEMEVAAQKILEKAEQAQSWEITLSLKEMGDDPTAQTGFLQLLGNGWLAPMPISKQSFGLTRDFIDRIVSKTGISFV